MVKPTALLESEDMFVLFDGCPTCKRDTGMYLVGCRVYAEAMNKRLRIVSSGSPTATAIRSIVREQGLTMKYPLILLGGLIYYAPEDINLDDYTIDEDDEGDDCNEDE